MLYFCVVAVVVGSDQLSKALLRGRDWEIVPGFFKIATVENTGTVAGFLADYPALLLALPATAIVFLTALYFRWAWQHRAMRWGIPLIAAGNLGNLLDRAILGHVTDWLHFTLSPLRMISVFNIADIAFVAGAACVLFGLKRAVEVERAKARHQGFDHE